MYCARRTNVPPRIARLVYRHARAIDVRSIAEIGKPHVLDVDIGEGLE